MQHGLGQVDVAGDLGGVAFQQFGQPVLAVHRDGAFPGEVVEPDVVQGDLAGLGAEQPGEVPLQADGHVAEADRAVPGVQQGPCDDADRVGEIDDPGVRAGALPCFPGDVEHHRHRAQRLGQPAGPGGFLADAAVFQRPGLVPLPGRLPADPQLEQHRAGLVQAVVQVGRPAQRGRVAERAQDPRAERADHGEPLLGRVDQHDLH